MTGSRHSDTVAFDVRDNAAMLFFARTGENGESTIDEDFDESMYIEVNERQEGGHDLLREARLIGNMLTLRFNEPMDVLDGASELSLSFAETPENLNGIEVGAFRVLGDALTGGNA
jgi:hypothetical protein